MKLTRTKIRDSLLLTLTESKYLNMFPHKHIQEYTGMGYKATTDMGSNIRVLIEVMATTLEDQLAGYEIPPPRKLGRVEKRTLEKAKIAQAKEDELRFQQLEQTWKEDKPRADKEMLDNAEKAAQNIYNKNQELKKTRD